MRLDQIIRGPTTEPDPLIREDEALVCPKCTYSLTGLTRERCPECGTSFDVSDLRHAASNRPTPATPWEFEADWAGFWTTLCMAVLAPRQLAQKFPRFPVPRKGLRYSLVCYGLASVCFLFFAVIFRPEDAPLAAIAVVAALIGSAVTEAVTATWLASFDT